MPTTSVIQAVITKYGTLTAANFPSSTRPPIYLDEAPAVDSSGVQERPGYVVLRDLGLVPNYLGFERHTAEVNEFELEVVYDSLADVDTAVSAIKLNGGTRDQAQGFDLGTLSDLVSPRSTHQVLRTREVRRFVGVSLADARVHSCTLSYRVTVQENP